MTLPSGYAAPDPFVFNNYPPQAAGGNQDTTGKTIADPRLVAGQNTAVIVVAGQSNSCNVSPSAYSPTNASKLDNITIYNGGTYRAADPLLGCQNIPLSPIGVGNVFSAAADKLVTDGVFDRVILIPVGIGGTTVGDWLNNASLYQRLVVAGRRASAVGLTVTAFTWMQGESNHGTSQATYQTQLGALIDIPRNAGFTAPWFIGKCTYLGGVVDPTVQAAQAAMANGTTIFAGANTDTLTGTSVYRQSDNTHLTNAGVAAAGTLWAAAINAVF